MSQYPSRNNSIRATDLGSDLDQLKLKYTSLSSLYHDQVRAKSGHQTTLKQVNHDRLTLIRPPHRLLPPFPPPSSNGDYPYSNQQTYLPPIEKQTKLKTANPRTIRKQPKKIKVVCSQKIDKATNTCPNYTDSSAFLCRLCGIQCLHGDLLYAHLLIIQHVFETLEIQPDSPDQLVQILTCRRCGKQWSEFESWHQVNQHGCVQSKAAFLRIKLAPKRALHYGLPWVCLFCCTESKLANKSFGKGNQNRSSTQIKSKRKKGFLRSYQTCNRFESKLHLAVHILCRHSVKRKPDTCGECCDSVEPDGETKDLSDASFWYVSDKPKRIVIQDDRSSSESEDLGCVSQLSTDSILWRQGLQPLEEHLDQRHLTSLEISYWLKLPSLIRKLTSHSEWVNWVYMCPICQLLNVDSWSQTRKSRYGYLSSNAMFQAHVACYHAGARQLDILCGKCQICDMNKSDLENSAKCAQHFTCSMDCQIRHLNQAGHVKRLEQNYEDAIRQGRLSLACSENDLDWTTTCFFCWRRFLVHDGDSFRILLAQCHLQTHLVVYHCAVDMNLKVSYDLDQISELDEIDRSCGWCQKPNTQKGMDSRMHKMTLNDLYASFQQHEKAHAWNLAVWWRDNACLQDQANPEMKII